jgi:aromatic-L-amino-acid decarboxylase
VSEIEGETGGGSSAPPLRTAIAILLDEIAAPLAAVRAELDPAAAARVPLHITVLHPFVSRGDLTPELLEELRRLFDARRPLSFTLDRLEFFPGQVVYAAPDRGDELTALMRDVAARYPETPPYGGAHDEPVPHATLARLDGGDDEAIVTAVRTRVEPLLPIPCTIDAVSLLEEFEPDRWRELERLPLSAATRDLHADTFRQDGSAALEWVASYLERVRELPVLAQVEPGQVRNALPASPPEHGEPFADVLRDLDAVLGPGLTHWQSPRYFAYFAATASEPGILAELLIAGLNQVGILWRTSPALQELEELTLDWLAQLLGLPAGLHGHIEDTASVGLVSALAAARAARPEARIVVCSEHTHSATAKAARLLELELRTLPSDAEFRLPAELLKLDDACAVVATIGTTSSAAIDPVPAIADRCEEAGVWLHVDAAYAGPAAVCPELRPLFAGWERADSIGVNPHKWLSVPMDCSAFWTRRPDDLRRAFSLVPEFLRSDEEVVSLSEYSLPLGRRFRALKLWAVLRCLGREGLQAIVREHVRLATLFEQWVRETSGWEVCATRHFSLVCFRRDGSDDVNEELLRRVNASGEVFLSHTRLNGRFVLRLAVGNARTTEEDVRVAWDVLRREAG